jgi:hypothetical protein
LLRAADKLIRETFALGCSLSLQPNIHAGNYPITREVLNTTVEDRPARRALRSLRREGTSAARGDKRYRSEVRK